MPRIRFTRNYSVKSADRTGPHYAAGQVVDVSPESAEHFVSRNAAVEVDEDEPVRPARVTKPPAGKPKDETEDEGSAGEAAAGAAGGGAATSPPAAPTSPPAARQGQQGQQHGTGGKPAAK